MCVINAFPFIKEKKIVFKGHNTYDINNSDIYFFFLMCAIDDAFPLIKGKK